MDHTNYTEDELKGILYREMQRKPPNLTIVNMAKMLLDQKSAAKKSDKKKPSFRTEELVPPPVVDKEEK